ncbi:hypothetical protein CONPUDRAFT_71596 [Coniophora puteana RWD-64-598 SS2]|uniref:Uncharacterized protein n=1 Tax=Coniophora puteana (strain RWD-64-598) TaxID=741705 RepID=A0A5M3MW47_CONPW|nr:uncharacterized protein CONPUDRAFT_71596 [Coniophora puteana RWD-64-598 SS2]EIW82935.1 hypothetical protein CONPUDRAFT_71596 [Coniophora puteana RWD-64-598 SS2]
MSPPPSKQKSRIAPNDNNSAHQARRQTRESADSKVSLKRPHSPDSSVHLSQPPSKAPTKRKKQDHASPQVNGTASNSPESEAINIPSNSSSTLTSGSLLPRSSTLSRLSPLSSLTRSSPVTNPSVVLSSQSDEHDMTMTPRQPKMKSISEVTNSVTKWRDDAVEDDDKVLTSSTSRDTEMVEADLQGTPSTDPPNVPLTPLTDPVSLPSEPDMGSDLPRLSTSPEPDVRAQASAAPASSLPSPPETRAADSSSDAGNDAADIIAQIKARVYAAGNSSDDEKQKTLELRDLSDSDEDSDLDLPAFRKNNGKGKRSGASSPSASSSRLRRSSKKAESTSSGSRSPSPSAGRRVSGRVRKVAGKAPQPLTQAAIEATEKARKKAHNPLEALLREKRSGQRRGIDADAVRMADEAVMNKDKYLDFDEDADFGSPAKKKLRAPFPLLSQADGGASDDEQVVVGNRETKLLGSRAGDAINQILFKDKASKGKERARELAELKAHGVAFWGRPHNNADMEVDTTRVQDLFADGRDSCHIIARLHELYVRGDVQRLSIFLGAGALNMLSPAELNLVIPSIFKLVDCLSALGARKDVLQVQGWSRSTVQRADADTRDQTLGKLLTLITAAARTDSVPSSDLPDMILALILVGLDTSTSHDTRIQLISALDALCRSITLAVESTVYNKLQTYIRQLNPTNKAYAVSLLASGNGRARYFAQWLAYSALVKAPASYSDDDLPPLNDLVSLLTVDAMFDVGSDDIDYDVLQQYVHLLDMWLVDIQAYVAEEKKMQPATPSASMAAIEDSPSKLRRKEPPLTFVRSALDVIHGRIVDTRAAHLERSRTKAALQRLSMRIYYQRSAMSKSGRPDLKVYFSPRKE